MFTDQDIKLLKEKIEEQNRNLLLKECFYYVTPITNGYILYKSILN